MKNIQIIDGAANATFSLFQAAKEEFAAIFPDGREMDLIEDVIERLGEDEAGRVLGQLWDRPILKRDAVGIHGTLFYDSEPPGIPSKWVDQSGAAGVVRTTMRMTASHPSSRRSRPRRWRPKADWPESGAAD